MNAQAQATGSMVLSKLLGSSSVANPYAAAASALGAMTGTTATSGSTGNKNDAAIDNSGWNVNFGSGSITSSADKREALSQWVTIASGSAALLVILKVIKG